MSTKRLDVELCSKPSRQAKQDTSIEVRQLRVVAYRWVNTRHEKQDHSLEAEIGYYPNLTKGDLIWESVAVCSDVIRTVSRPGHQQLMRDRAKGKVDLILVKSHSRFDRDALEITHSIKGWKNEYRSPYREWRDGHLEYRSQHDRPACRAGSDSVYTSQKK